MAWDSLLAIDQEKALSKIIVPLRNAARKSAWTRAIRSSYGTAWRSWLSFCEVMKVDPLCKHANGVPRTPSETIDLITSYVTVQCGVRVVSPISIGKTYLPGIASTFDMLGEHNHFRACYVSRDVKLVAKGFQRFYEKHNPEAGEFKMPFGMDLALRAKRILKERLKGMRNGDVIVQRAFLVLSSRNTIPT